MALKVVWAKRSENEFENIIDYLFENWGESSAKFFVIKVNNLIELLSVFPNLGVLEIKAKNVRSYTLVKQINVFYKVEKDRIIILNFFDNRQNPDKKFI